MNNSKYSRVFAIFFINSPSRLSVQKTFRPTQTRNDNALNDTNSPDVRDIMPPYLHKYQVHNA